MHSLPQYWLKITSQLYTLATLSQGKEPQCLLDKRLSGPLRNYVEMDLRDVAWSDVNWTEPPQAYSLLMGLCKQNDECLES
jgi:hypothetical protein